MKNITGKLYEEYVSDDRKRYNNFELYSCHDNYRRHVFQNTEIKRRIFVPHARDYNPEALSTSQINEYFDFIKKLGYSGKFHENLTLEEDNGTGDCHRAILDVDRNELKGVKIEFLDKYDKHEIEPLMGIERGKFDSITIDKILTSNELNDIAERGAHNISADYKGICGNHKWFLNANYFRFVETKEPLMDILKKYVIKEISVNAKRAETKVTNAITMNVDEVMNNFNLTTKEIKEKRVGSLLLFMHQLARLPFRNPSFVKRILELKDEFNEADEWKIFYLACIQGTKMKWDSYYDPFVNIAKNASVVPKFVPYEDVVNGILTNGNILRAISSNGNMPKSIIGVKRNLFNAFQEKVKCIDETGCIGLRKGKEYTLIEETTNGLFKVENDMGEFRNYKKSRFND